MSSFLKQEIYSFSKQSQFYILPEKSLFLLKGPLGFCLLRLPSYYFYKVESNTISFIFTQKRFFLSFLKHLSYLHQRLLKFFFIRLRLLGLGYRFKKLGNFLFRFYFNMEMFTYFHVPSNVILRSRRGKILLVSNDLSVLKSVLAQILLLKKAGGYNKRGIWYAKSILSLRKRRKL